MNIPRNYLSSWETRINKSSNCWNQSTFVKKKVFGSYYGMGASSLFSICRQNGFFFTMIVEGLPWSWSYVSWIYNYLCNQCLSPLTLWVRILLRRGVLDKTLCDKVCHW